MNNQTEESRLKAFKYIECLEAEICFVNDCFYGIQYILENAETTYRPIKKRAFAATALQAFQNEIIITLAKLFDNTKCNDVVSIYSIINIFESNKRSFDIIWQKGKYSDFCGKYNINEYVIAIDPSLKFVSIEEAIQNFNESIDAYEKTISNIKAQRDKYFAHNDKKYCTCKNLSELSERFAFTRQELDDILQISHLFLTQVSRATGKTPLSERSLGYTI